MVAKIAPAQELLAEMNEEFCDVGHGITLCYETFGEKHNPAVVLIMGLSTQMIAWHRDFCNALADKGFYVVRFDNRDIGRSTHVDGKPPTPVQLLLRAKGAAHYDLADMAEDTANLIKRLDIAPAHIVGASMGGMIAQTVAARHPEVVRSLTSIMSTTGNRRYGQPSFKTYPVLLRKRPNSRESYIASVEHIFSLIGSPGIHRSPEDIRSLAEQSYERDHDPRGPGRQLAAIIASGNRTKELQEIKAPTLVIHGDSDILIHPSGGKATFNAIPDARFVSIMGMGHDMPRELWPRIIDLISEHAHFTQQY